MTLRKGKKRTAPDRTASSKKLRTPLPPQKWKYREQAAEVMVDMARGKDWAWIIEGIKREFQHKRRTRMPRDLKPELATLKEEPFNHKDWQFEIKWDGYRALAYTQGGKADLRSRNNGSFNRRFPAIVKALEVWPVNAVVDGEVVVLSEEGKSDFAALQAWDQAPRGQLIYYVFDLLWVEGIDLQKEPLTVRREVLRRLVPDRGPIRYSDSIEECGIDFFKAARDNGLEGIIAKKKSAPYKAATRTKDWYKIKADRRHEAVICGYTRKRDTDREFSSLVLGLPSRGGLQFIGQVGTGFSGALQKAILQTLRPLTTKQCPFDEEPLISDPVQWVRPFLVCEVKYTERTREGLIRHPSFQGLREDKSAFELNIEEEQNGAGEKEEAADDRKQLIEPDEESATITLKGHELRLTNLTKPFWIKEGLTKGDLLNYYCTMAPFIMPYMKDRPQSLNRYPDGAGGKSFYQKNMKGKTEPWIKTFERASDSGSGVKDFLVCTDEASLLYMANLGCIEMNPWHSRVTKPHYPDWCVIDLDPGDIAFNKVIETARVVRSVLDSLEVPSYPKTSGSTGLHIYIPLGGKYNYEQSRQLAELIATLV
ncbi:MAG TPA: DNA ligase D, partial [Chitinophagaceae bacterium]